VSFYLCGRRNLYDYRNEIRAALGEAEAMALGDVEGLVVCMQEGEVIGRSRWSSHGSYVGAAEDG